MEPWSQKLNELLKDLEISPNQLATLEAYMAERDRTEHALRESEARIRAILNTTVDGIITTDEKGIILSFNPAAEKVFGYRAEEVIGESVGLLMPKPMQQEHAAYMQEYLKSGKARIIGTGREVIGLRKDGDKFPLELSVSEVRVGDRLMFTGIVRDITERKRAEDALVSASEYERKVIGQELHDALGQELTGISLLASALERKLALQQREETRDAAEITRISQTVLTQVKRLAHGLYPTDIDKNGLTSALVELAGNQQRLHNIPCAFEASNHTPALDAPTELHLYRIAQEAVVNAIRHGQVKNISITYAVKDETVVLVIEDDGIGLPDPLPEKTGMGLAIMRYRSDQIGASIEFLRRHSGGTRIRCRLPLRDNPG